MKPRIGATLASTVDPTTVVVIRWGAEDVELTCGGVAMVDITADVRPAGPRVADPMQQDGTQLGKRYADDERGVEVLCTKPGAGTLAVAGRPLPLKGAKPLPSSD